MAAPQKKRQPGAQLVPPPPATAPLVLPAQNPLPAAVEPQQIAYAPPVAPPMPPAAGAVPITTPHGYLPEQAQAANLTQAGPIVPAVAAQQQQAGAAPIFLGARPSPMFGTPEIQDRMQKAMLQNLDIAEHGGYTPAERRQQKVADVFSNIVFPALGLFGGAGGAQAGLDLIAQAKQDVQNRKTAAKEKVNQAIAAMKLLTDISTNIDPNSIKAYSAQQKGLAAGANIPINQQKADAATSQAQTAKEVGSARVADLKSQTSEREALKPGKVTAQGLAAKETEAKIANIGADTEIKQLSKKYLGDEKAAKIALDKVQAEYLRLKGAEYPQDAESQRALRSAMVEALKGIKTEQGKVTVTKGKAETAKIEAQTKFTQTLLKMMDPTAGAVVEAVSADDMAAARAELARRGIK